MRFKLLFVSFLLVFPFTAVFAQKIDMKLLPGLRARSIGPAGMSGRVTAIDVKLSDPKTIFIGTASGGVWKSESGGVSWEPIFDDQDFLSIGALKIDQNVDDIIWVGGGEGNPRNSQSSGNGVYKSIDGGETWKHLGLENTRNIHRIIIDPRDSETVYLGVQGYAWANSPERGVYKTVDGGKTWNKILYVNDSTGIADLIMDPSNPNKLFAAMWEFDRDPWHFNSGGKGSGLYVTYDGGENWKKLTSKDGLPKGDIGKIGLGMSAADPDIVYALIESKKNALYKSYDGGKSWKQIATKNIGNRPFYYFEIHVDPKDPKRLYSLYSRVNVSDDGGKTFRQLIGWEIHPDHHAWWIHPEDPNFMIDGNDGGLAITHDKGQTWRFVRNLPLAQFYHINYDMDDPYNIYGGMQDNGSWVGPSSTFRSGGIRNIYWQGIGGGDGFDVVPDPADSRFGYSMSQGGAVQRYDVKTGYRNGIRPTHPDADVKLRFNWNAAIAQCPHDDATIYYGSQFVHKSSDRGSNWEIISPDLTTNDTAKQKQETSGGLTYDDTGAENFTTIIAIDPSPLNKDIIWVGTDDGNVQVTRDGGVTWSNVVENIKKVPKGAWVPQVHASKYDEAKAFVVINDYRRGDWTPYVYYTEDYGQKWTAIVSKDQVNGYALSFVQDPVAEDLYWLGTEGGLYFSIDAGANWTKWDKNYPSVSTMDLKVHPREHDIVIGTFGRSAYIIDNIQPLRELALKDTSLLRKAIHIFPIPDAELTMRKSAPGYFSPGAGEYRGENKASGAMISYIVSPVKKVKDSVLIQIYDKYDSLMTTIRKTPKEGIMRTYWWLNEKGIRQPGRAKPKDKNYEPWGGSVMPGKYKVKLTYNDNVDSTYVNVGWYRNLPFDEEALLMRKEIKLEFEKEITAMTELADQLRDAQKIVKQIGGVVKSLEGDNYKDLKKLQKTTNDTIRYFLDHFEQKEYQGIRYDEDKLSVQISRAYYSLSGFDKPGQTEERAIAKAKPLMDKWTKEVDAYLNEGWNLYKDAIKENEVDFFSTVDF